MKKMLQVNNLPNFKSKFVASMSTDTERRDIFTGPYKRLDYPEDSNFNHLIRNWSGYKDDVIVFLGAGASVGAWNDDGEYFPNAYELRNELWREFFLEEHEREGYDFDRLGLMSLDHATSLIETRANRRRVEEFIARKFYSEKTLWQHAMLPYLNPLSIFTTNYDRLIELGFQSFDGRQVKNIAAKYNHTTSFNKKDVTLYKPHGCISQPHSKVTEGGFVISQFDYFEVETAKNAMLDKFVGELDNKCVLFIGYSFFDFDIAMRLFRIARNNINNRQNWYAIFPRNDEAVREMYKDKYGIRQINRTFFDFMIDLDKNVNFIPENYKFEKVNLNFFQNGDNM